jgi:hypothetical protein
MTTWQALFERAADHDVDVSAVTDALADERDE